MALLNNQLLCLTPSIAAAAAVKPSRYASSPSRFLHGFFALAETTKEQRSFSLYAAAAVASARLPCSSPFPKPSPRVSATRSTERRSGDPAGASWQSDEDLGDQSDAFKKTLRLVECAMFASVAGLAYLLSNSLAIENYFGCFFALPIVITSMRWGVAAGRKTMVATAILLLTLSGPVKASTYLLMHGLLGLAMGTFWRLQINWTTSIVLCTLVRALGAIGYVLVSSFLIRENILALITINIHASLSYVLMAVGVNTVPSMDAIYVIFGSLLLLNSGFFIFLLHILYAVFLTKLGMRTSLTLPRWLQKAL